MKVAEFAKIACTSLYAHYTGDHHIDDRIMLLLVRAIKVVMNYEGDA